MKTKHGHCTGGKTSRTYNAWTAMRDRCTCRSNPAWPNYGGKGISVCKEWEKFSAFLQDMGECPPELELDRKDNSKGYYKENCRWATRADQAINRGSYRNNTSGVPGVSYHSTQGLWYASLQRRGKRTIIGKFVDKDNAIAARRITELVWKMENSSS